MTTVDIVALPNELKPHQVANRAVAVFDVLRATTTIVAALRAGAREICVFDSIESAAAACRSCADAKLLCGETRCLPPPGFDLGNSPVEFTADRVAGKTIFLSTTNGTRAIVAARGAAKLFAASLVNRMATARALLILDLDVTLLCAGTNGKVAPEDLLGAGAVLDAMMRINTSIELTSKVAREGVQRYRDLGSNLRQILRDTEGGRNVMAAGLEADIDFAARLDDFEVVAEITGADPPIARLSSQ